MIFFTKLADIQPGYFFICIIGTCSDYGIGPNACHYFHFFIGVDNRMVLVHYQDAGRLVFNDRFVELLEFGNFIFNALVVNNIIGKPGDETFDRIFRRFILFCQGFFTFFYSSADSQKFVQRTVKLIGNLAVKLQGSRTGPVDYGGKIRLGDVQFIGKCALRAPFFFVFFNKELGCQVKEFV